MKTIKTKGVAFDMPAIVQGCMRIAKMSIADAERLIMTGVEAGITMFDHADIYGKAKAQGVFGQVLGRNPGLREKIILQSKSGISEGIYDFSKKHILESCEQNLSELGIEQLDILLLHRPDALMDPEEVADALDTLHRQGKVRYFGVSNQTPGMIELLSKYVKQPFHFNQLQFGLMHAGMIGQGLNMNTMQEEATDRDNGILHYCWKNDITIQAWSPYQYGHMDGVYLDNPGFPEVNKAIREVAEAHGVQPEAIPAAFILRHPAHIQAIVGTTNPDRVRAIAAASDIALTREEWYKLYMAAGNNVL